MNRIWAPALLASALLLSACATPATRIRQHPDIYARATPQQQALISQGRIGLGFSPAFVALALGAPDRITERTDKTGTETVWHYVEYQYDNSFVAFGAYPFYPYYGGPFFGDPFAPIIIQGPPTEHDRLRVVFKNHQVTSIEQVVKN